MSSGTSPCIVRDPVSDQTACPAVSNRDDTEVNCNDCAAMVRSDLEIRNVSTVSPKLAGAGDEWNPASNRVPIDSRCMRMMLPRDSDQRIEWSSPRSYSLGMTEYCTATSSEVVKCFPVPRLSG
jgi:hypothetical protein